MIHKVGLFEKIFLGSVPNLLWYRRKEGFLTGQGRDIGIVYRRDDSY